MRTKIEVVYFLFTTQCNQPQSVSEKVSVDTVIASFNVSTRKRTNQISTSGMGGWMGWGGSIRYLKIASVRAVKKDTILHRVRTVK